MRAIRGSRRFVPALRILSLVVQFARESQAKREGASRYPKHIRNSSANGIQLGMLECYRLNFMQARRGRFGGAAQPTHHTNGKARSQTALGVETGVRSAPVIMRTLQTRSQHSFQNLRLSGIPQRTVSELHTTSHLAVRERFGGDARTIQSTNGKHGYSHAQSEATDVRFAVRGRSHEKGRLL